ncbi:hypothetical protein TNCV_4674641 [Trichonephila clavipes]|nr:hypothetical protein TNCV_4674641 [Trichonephila clavipes]
MKKAAAEEKIIDGTINSVVVSEKIIADLLRNESLRNAENFFRSEQKHGLKYQRYIGDGDSKTFLSIAEKIHMGIVFPLKIECVGHVQKRMGSRLRKLKALWGKEAFPMGNNWWERSPNRCYYKQIDDFLWQCYSCQLP